MFSWAGKVTARTSFASLIWNPGFWFAAVLAARIQFLGHFNWRLTSQSTKGISVVLQKWFRYINGAIISTSFVPPFPVFPLFAV